MSYFKKDVDDNVNALFSRLADLNMTIKHLMSVNDKESFEIWIEKCIQIDKRSTFLYLKKNKSSLKEEFLDIIKFHYPEENYGKF